MLKSPLRVPAGAAPANGRPLSGLGKRRHPLRWAIGAVALVALAAAAYFGYTRVQAAQTPPAPPQTIAARRATVASSVSSTGTVAPLTQAKLSFAGSGRVAGVAVKVGDAVAKGQPLAELDTTDLALQVSQAKASLSSAQAKLASIKAGSRAEDIRAAQAALDAANAKLAAMLAGGRPESIAQAQAQLASAKAKLDALVAPPTDADLKVAQQAVTDAQTGLQKAQSALSALTGGPAPQDLKNAQLAVDQAKNSLWSQQLSRDGVCGNARNPKYQCDAANAQVAAAETGIQTAENNLAKLQAPPKPGDIAADQQAVTSAQAALAAAQAKLAQIRAGPTADQVAQAEADVTQAQQSLTLQQKPYTDADIQAQRQAVAAAQAALVAKQAPYTDADVQSAQAAVDQAQAQLDAAQYALSNATLVAPFAGVVNSVGFNVGEQASGASVITLVDPKTVRLDVSVDETDIAKVATGQRATITFDSIAGKSHAGKVTAIAPNATIQSGVATYAVSLSIDNSDSIRPGMTGNATIVYSEVPDALVVPNRAIHTQGRARTVQVLVNGKPESRTVEVGASNDTISQITSGLSVGDQVVVSGTTAAAPRVGGLGGPGGGFGGGFGR